MDTLSNKYIIEKGIGLLSSGDSPIIYTVIFLLIFSVIAFYVARNIISPMKENWKNQKTDLLEKNVRLKTHFATLNPSPLFTILSISHIEPFNESAIKLVERNARIIEELRTSISLRNYNIYEIIKNNSLQNFIEKFGENYYSIYLKGDSLLNYAQLYLNDITQLKSTQIDLANSQKRLKELSDYYIQKSEDEKKSISQELHDAVGNNLAMLKLALQNIENKTKASEMTELYKKIDSISSEIKEISYILNPSILQRSGLADAVKYFIESCNSFQKIKGTLSVHGNILRYSETIELNIYRIIQEAVSNIFKHSQSDTYQINILFDDNKLSVVITDNGIGFDDEKIFDDNKNHLGLINMEERVYSLNGTIDIESFISMGTKIFITVPAIGKNENV